MGRQRGKLGSLQCGRVGRHMLTTSQGNDSQNEPQHQQGVTRPQLILALVSAENSPNEIEIAIVGTDEVDINAS